MHEVKALLFEIFWPFVDQRNSILGEGQQILSPQDVLIDGKYLPMSSTTHTSLR